MKYATLNLGCYKYGEWLPLGVRVIIKRRQEGIFWSAGKVPYPEQLII